MSAVSSTFSISSTTDGSICFLPAKISPRRAMKPERVRARPGASAAPLRAGAGAGNGMTWAGGARGLGGRRRRFRRPRGRGRTGGPRGAASGSGAASSALGSAPRGLFFGLLGGLQLSGLRLAEARGRGLADSVDHALPGGAGAPNQQEADQAAGDDAAHDPEQLIELGGVYRRARRVHGGWDIITKRRCSSMSYPASPCGMWQSSCNLPAVDECATVYSVLARVIQESAAVTIHFTYCHATRTLSRRGI